MGSAETTVESQLALARDEAERLRGGHGQGGQTARELYRVLLRFLEKRCPAVFLQLNGKTLYDLLRKGSQPVSGEVLREYRAQVAMRLEAHPSMPIPKEALTSLGDSLGLIWDSAFQIARREAADLAEVRNVALAERVESLLKENEELRAQLAQAGASERELSVGLEASHAEVARQAAEVGTLTVEVKTLSSERDGLRKALSDVHESSNARVDELSRALGVEQASRQTDNKRALQEIDGARLETRKLQKRLDEALERAASVESMLGQRTQSLLESQRALTELGGQLARLAAHKPAEPPVAGKDGAVALDTGTGRDNPVRAGKRAKASAPQAAPIPAKRKAAAKRKPRSG